LERIDADLQAAETRAAKADEERRAAYGQRDASKRREDELASQNAQLAVQTRYLQALQAGYNPTQAQQYAQGTPVPMPQAPVQPQDPYYAPADQQGQGQPAYDPRVFQAALAPLTEQINVLRQATAMRELEAIAEQPTDGFPARVRRPIVADAYEAIRNRTVSPHMIGDYITREAAAARAELEEYGTKSQIGSMRRRQDEIRRLMSNNQVSHGGGGAAPTGSAVPQVPLTAQDAWDFAARSMGDPSFMPSAGPRIPRGS